MTLSDFLQLRDTKRMSPGHNLGPSKFVRRNRTAHGAHLLSRAVKLERLSKMFLKSLLGFEGDRRVKAALAELE